MEIDIVILSQRWGSACYEVLGISTKEAKQRVAYWKAQTKSQNIATCNTRYGPRSLWTGWCETNLRAGPTYVKSAKNMPRITLLMDENYQLVDFLNWIWGWSRKQTNKQIMVIKC